jgi:hypothetical protein
LSFKVTLHEQIANLYLREPAVLRARPKSGDATRTRRPRPHCRRRPGQSSHSKTFSTTSTARQLFIMVRGVEGNEMSTPRPSQKKQPPSASQSAKNQKSILGFFQKKSTNSPSPAPTKPTPVKGTPATLSRNSFNRQPASTTPVPSSDAVQPSSPVQDEQDTPVGRNKENGLHLDAVSHSTYADGVASEVAGVALSSPSRKVGSFMRLVRNRS